MEAVKAPVEQNFLHILPGDKLISPNGIVQTAGAMSAIAVQQPDKTWNIVQLNAKGYTVIKENIPTRQQETLPSPLQVMNKRARQIRFTGKATRVATRLHRLRRPSRPQNQQ